MTARISSPPRISGRLALTGRKPRPIDEPVACRPEQAQGADGAEREKMIREAAYFRAQQRAFAPGSELQDWLSAERQIDGMLAQSAAIGKAAPAADPERL